MRADLSSSQWGAVEHGRLTAPDGTSYVRRTTRTKRRTCDGLVAAGAPLVLYYWAGGQLDWCDGPEAGEAWADVRGAVTAQEPRPEKRMEWTAGLWEDADGQQIILLTGHC